MADSFPLIAYDKAACDKERPKRASETTENKAPKCPADPA
jgi:hypothetical protein